MIVINKRSKCIHPKGVCRAKFVGNLILQKLVQSVVETRIFHPCL